MSNQELIECGPWSAEGDKIVSSDFTHDVVMYLINGDFADAEDKHRYAQMIADQLNALPAAEARIKELERGEYICKKCGLRKDSDHEHGDF